MSPGAPIGVVVLGVAVPIVLLGLRFAAGRDEWVRSRMLKMYAQDSPLFFRNVMSLAPLWGAGALVFGLPFLLPKPWAAFLAKFGLAITLLAFVLSYRVPAPLMPGWLRDEMDADRVAVARPDRMDWALFWLVAPVGVLAIAGWVILLAWGKYAT